MFDPIPQSNTAQPPQDDEWEDLPLELDPLVKKLQDEFSVKFKRPFRITTPVGGAGLKGIHNRVYGGNAVDIGGSDLSDDEANWLVGQASKYGIRANDYRKNWKSIGGSGPHLHFDLKGMNIDPSLPDTKSPVVAGPDNEWEDIPIDAMVEPISGTVTASAKFQAPTADLDRIKARISEIEKSFSVLTGGGKQLLGETTEALYKRLWPEYKELTDKYNLLISQKQDQSSSPGILVTPQTAGTVNMQPGEGVENLTEEEAIKKYGQDAIIRDDSRIFMEKMRSGDEDTIYREWYNALKAGQFHRASLAAQTYESQFPVGKGKYSNYVYDPVSGIGRTSLAEQKQAREGAVAIPVGDLLQSGLTGEALRAEVERRFAQGMGFDDSTREIFRQSQGYDPASTSAYYAGREFVKQTPQEFEQWLKNTAGDDGTVFIRVPKISAERVQAFFNQKGLSQPSQAQADLAQNQIRGRTGTVGAIEDVVGQDVMQGVHQFASGATQGALGTLGSAMKGTGVLLGEVTRWLKDDYQSKTPISDLFMSGGNWLNQFAKSASFERDPDVKGVGLYDIGQGLGSGGTFALTGTMGSIGAGFAGALTQAGSAYDETYERLTRQGYAPEQAHRAAVNAAIISMPVGFSEMAGAGGTFERLARESMSGVGFARNLLAKIAEGAYEEGITQERFQNRMENIIARVSGDPKRPLGENEARSVIIGMLTGGIMDAGVNLISGPDIETEIDASRPITAMRMSVPSIESMRQRLGDEEVLTHIQNSVARRYGLSDFEVGILTEKYGVHPFSGIVEPGTTTGASLDSIIQDGRNAGGLSEFRVSPELVAMLSRDLGREVTLTDPMALPPAPKDIEAVAQVGPFAVSGQGQAAQIPTPPAPSPVSVDAVGNTDIANAFTERMRSATPILQLPITVPAITPERLESVTVPSEILSKEIPPIPETQTALNAQMQALLDKHKMAVLLTPGEPVPSAPPGFVNTQTDVGTFVHHPAITQDILDSVEDGTYGKYLGYVAAKPEQNEASVMVTALDTTGKEIQSAVVAPEDVAAQTQVFKRLYPEAIVESGGTELANAVLEERAREIPSDNTEKFTDITDSAINTENGTVSAPQPGTAIIDGNVISSLLDHGQEWEAHKLAKEIRRNNESVDPETARRLADLYGKLRMDEEATYFRKQIEDISQSINQAESAFSEQDKEQQSRALKELENTERSLLNILDLDPEGSTAYGKIKKRNIINLLRRNRERQHDPSGKELYSRTETRQEFLSDAASPTKRAEREQVLDYYFAVLDEWLNLGGVAENETLIGGSETKIQPAQEAETEIQSAQKPKHQMSKRDARIAGVSETERRWAVEKALKKGVEVPVEVLADFPNLQTESTPMAKQVGLRLRQDLHRKYNADLPASRLANDLPGLHRSMLEAGLDIAGQIEAFDIIGFNFQNPLQMVGIIRGVQVELNQAPRVNLDYRAAFEVIIPMA